MKETILETLARLHELYGDWPVKSQLRNVVADRFREWQFSFPEYHQALTELQQEGKIVAGRWHYELVDYG